MSIKSSFPFLLYDAEIKLAIPDRVEPRRPGIVYCEGWHDKANMGVSVICAYDYAEHRFRVFLEDNFHEFAMLCGVRRLVGFNSLTFDDELLNASGFSGILSAYDVLRETYAAKGLNPFPERFSAAYKGCGLGAMCTATYGAAKSGSGELAPMLWQQGKIGALIDYCLHDVGLLKGLFDRVLAGTPLIDPKSGQRLTLRHPEGGSFAPIPRP